MMISQEEIYIAKELRKQRIALGLKQKEVGIIVKTTNTTISKLERGLRRMSLAELLSICGCLGLKPSDLLIQVTLRINEDGKNSENRVIT